VLAVNLTGPFLCSRELVRRLPADVRAASILKVIDGGMSVYPRFV